MPRRQGFPISLIALAAASCGNVTMEAAADGGSDAGIKPPTVAVNAGAPLYWQEHWFEHTQLLRKVSETEDDVLYFDNDMDPASAIWIQPLVASIWRYTKQTYGVPGDPRLFAVFHAGRYEGEHSASTFDPTHDNRNVIDLGGSPMVWSESSSAYKIAYSAGQVLEKNALGFDNLPSTALSDFEFGYFFAYDALKAVGMSASADAWLSAMMKHSVDKPQQATFWTRDWYYPLWRDHGGAAVFARFIKLVADNYPKLHRDDRSSKMFARAMNWGEYVHFMSGAAGTDLKTLATKAFGWPASWDDQYMQARIDFPGISYGTLR